MDIVYHHRTRGAHVEGVHIRGIVSALRSLGHRVDVVSFPGADPEQSPGEKPPGNKSPTDKSSTPANKRGGMLRALARHLPEFMFELLELAYNVFTFGRLHHRFGGQEPDLVYERYSLFLFATVRLCRRRGIPIILEINDSALVERVRPLVFKRLARKIESWVFRNATGLVFISSAFKDTAEQAYGQIATSVVSPNAADCAVFDPDLFDRAAVRRELGIGDKVVCGYVGAFVHWHGIHWLVEEIVETLKQRDDLVLLLVGDGVMLPAIAQQVEAEGLADKILLPGRVEHNAVPGLIAAMDLAVLPDSNTYGSPMKVFEFMAMGVGVVAPDYGPLREVIQDQATGWLFPSKDKRRCVQCIESLLENPEQINQIGRAARDYIKTERQWHNNATDLLALLG